MTNRAVALLFVAGCLAPLWSLSDMLNHYPRYSKETAAAAAAILSFRWFQVLAGIVPLMLLVKSVVVHRMLPGDQIKGWLQARRFIVTCFAALLVTSFVYGFGVFENSRFLLRSFFNSTLVLVIGIWCIQFLNSAKCHSPVNTWMNSLEILSFNLVLVIVFSEVTLNSFSRYSPSPLLWDQSSIESRISAHKMKPGARFFNTRINSDGYHDTEFFSATDNDFVVGMLSDSFGVGVVPYEYNFATVAEARLQRELAGQYDRIAIHNFGVPGIGMDEYAYLFNSEVAGYNPSLILVSVFIGNDLIDVRSSRREYYAIQNWMIYQLPKRVAAIIRENRGNKQNNVTTIGQSPVPDGRVPAHIFDWRKEKPTMSEQVFLKYEQDRLEICNSMGQSIDQLYQRFFKIAGYFQATLGDKVIFVLIPDEFQVNDALFKQLIETKSSPEYYQRDYPQKKITDYFRKNNIDYIDLLPVLRMHEEEGRTYHLQNTHWNARGNRIAGMEIASYVLAKLGRPESP